MAHRQSVASRSDSLDVKRILVFIVFSFGIAWITALYIYQTGGLRNSPMVFPAIGLTRAFLLLVVAYMPAPALAHVLTRLFTGEGWDNLWLRPRFRDGWLYWLAAWVLPALLVFVGSALYFAFFPAHFDPSLGPVREMLERSAEQTGQQPPISPQMLIVVQLVQGLILAPIINAIPVFGEEFGWRAYLQPKLLPLGWRPAMVLVGIIWGVWHWPIIAMGYNYGFDYPGAPWMGPLAMVWFTFVVGTIFGWLTLKGRSVWPAVIGHGALNGIAGAAGFFVQGQPNSLLGPFPTGVIGGAGFTLVALWMLFNDPTISEASPVDETAVQQVESA